MTKYYGVKFVSDSETYKECSNLMTSLYNAIEAYDNKNIESITNSLIKITNPIKSFAYFKELNHISNISYKHYIKNEYVNKNEIYSLINLMNIWDNHLSSIILDMCESVNYNFFYSSEISNLIYKNITVRDAISKYWLLREEVSHLNYASALELANELINYFEKTENQERKTLIMLKEFNIYRDIDNNKAIEYTKKLEALLTDSKTTDKIKKNVSFSLAMFFYLNFNYTKALEYYKMSFTYSKRAATLLYIYSCESRLECLEDHRKILENKSSLDTYIRYFDMKVEKTNDEILEKYIMKEILQVLSNEIYRDPLWTMFEYELNKLVKKTRNYKNLSIYNDKMLQTTNSAH